MDEISALREKLKLIISEIYAFDSSEANDAFESIAHMIKDDDKRDAFMRGCVWTIEKIVEKVERKNVL